MKRVLIVEDDATIARIYQGLIRMEGLEADVAKDGDEALDRLANARPDLVLLDLMLPKRNGIQILKHIRAQAALADLPVLVFTNAYMGSLMRDALLAGATHCLAKAQSRPKQVVQTIRGYLALQNSTAAATDPFEAEMGPDKGVPGVRADGAPPVAAATPKTGRAQTDIAQIRSLLSDMRGRLQVLVKGDQDAGRLSHWSALCLNLETLVRDARMAGQGVVAQLAGALEGLACELRGKAGKATASGLRALAQGLDCLENLVLKATDGKAEPAKRSMVLVLDDDAVSRRLISSSIERVGLRCIALFDPNTALKVIMANSFDLIFLDVDMPGRNGFDLCKELRHSDNKVATPVIFVTGLNDLESRALSVMSGADDFVRKPFCAAELGVRALLHILNPRSRPNPAAGEGSRSEPAATRGVSSPPKATEIPPSPSSSQLLPKETTALTTAGTGR